MSGKTLKPASRLKSVKDPFHLLSYTIMYVFLKMFSCFQVVLPVVFPLFYCLIIVPQVVLIM